MVSANYLFLIFRAYLSNFKALFAFELLNLYLYINSKKIAENGSEITRSSRTNIRRTIR